MYEVVDSRCLRFVGAGDVLIWGEEMSNLGFQVGDDDTSPHGFKQIPITSVRRAQKLARRKGRSGMFTHSLNLKPACFSHQASLHTYLYTRCLWCNHETSELTFAGKTPRSAVFVLGAVDMQTGPPRPAQCRGQVGLLSLGFRGWGLGSGRRVRLGLRIYRVVQRSLPGTNVANSRLPVHTMEAEGVRCSMSTD